MSLDPTSEFARAVEPAMRQVMANSQVPGLVVVAQRADEPVLGAAAGQDASGQPLALETLFPVASISKLATSLAVLRLVASGRIHLDDPLGDYLPGAAGTQPGVTIRRLLSHSAGLPLDPPAESNFVAESQSWSSAAQVCRKTALVWPPGSRVQYSNVGYGLLALVVERLTGVNFADALRNLLLDFLPANTFVVGEPALPVAVIAERRGPHGHAAGERFNSSEWRAAALPWAGLVTNGLGALALVRAFRSPSPILPTALCHAATTNQNDDLPGGFLPPFVWPVCWWGLGPDLRDRKSPHWTPGAASPNTYGHSGASGCCVWDDPTRDLRWAILGARSADSGWLVRAGAHIGTTVIDVLSPES